MTDKDIEAVALVKNAILRREHILDTLDLEQWREQIAEADATTAVAALQSAGWLSPADATAMAQAAHTRRPLTREECEELQRQLLQEMAERAKIEAALKENENE